MPRIRVAESVQQLREPRHTRSATNPDVVYTQRYIPGFGWVCDCLGFGYWSKCRHSDKWNAEDAARGGEPDEP